MKQTFHLGTWRGIRVGAHWSLLIVAWLLTWSLADSLLPEVAPGYSTDAYWVAGSLTSVAFLLAIGAHEMSHAVVALREGVGVSKVTLWVFGGIAELSSQPPTWRSQFDIAIAGPIASGVIAGLGLGGSSLLASVGSDGLASESLAWLGGTNLMLAVFNLLPGAPLDGGRVLTALRWRSHGDSHRARREAAAAGMMLGRVMVTTGVLLVFFAPGGAGLWIGLLGWFVGSAARAEGRAETVEEMLTGVRVRDIMSHRPTTIAPSMSLATVVDQVIATTHHTSLPVVIDDRPVGLLTPKQIQAVPAGDWDTTSAGTAALRMHAVTTATEDEPVLDLLRRLGTDQERVVVLDLLGRVCGIVTPTDMLATVQRELLRHRIADPVGT